MGRAATFSPSQLLFLPLPLLPFCSIFSVSPCLLSSLNVPVVNVNDLLNVCPGFVDPSQPVGGVSYLFFALHSNQSSCSWTWLPGQLRMW